GPHELSDRGQPAQLPRHAPTGTRGCRRRVLGAAGACRRTRLDADTCGLERPDGRGAPRERTVVGSVLPGDPNARQHRRRHGRACADPARPQLRDARGSNIAACDPAAADRHVGRLRPDELHRSHRGTGLLAGLSRGRGLQRPAGRRRGRAMGHHLRALRDRPRRRVRRRRTGSASSVVPGHSLQPRRQARPRIDSEAGRDRLTEDHEIQTPWANPTAASRPNPANETITALRSRGRAAVTKASVTKSGKSPSRKRGTLTRGTTAAGALSQSTIVAAEYTAAARSTFLQQIQVRTQAAASSTNCTMFQIANCSGFPKPCGAPLWAGRCRTSCASPCSADFAAAHAPPRGPVAGTWRSQNAPSEWTKANASPKC